ncbi:hypothetical protein CEXT_507001 [Caerostris extrusa]|uniref:Uncharacterized protein n=1 Tax=Caerostris extrusa TaxID=172846 RepID=A0AAV4XAW8_CAEEX|nr:hypothetical protein CEXT_507001 [Caerostris extrusa]
MAIPLARMSLRIGLGKRGGKLKADAILVETQNSLNYDISFKTEKDNNDITQKAKTKCTHLLMKNPLTKVLPEVLQKVSL